MASKALSKEEILSMLQEGGELWYFFLHGGVAVHDRDGNPIRDCHCPIDVFLALREDNVIVMTEREKTGYPFYANNHISSTYKLAQANHKTKPRA